MPLPLPNLDDRTYADLVEEAISLIPIEAPEWTDRNPSDTGIVLIELLAWLTEMVLYRVNQIPDCNQAAFLTLLKGQPWTLPADKSPAEQNAILQAEIQKTLAQLRRPYRAVTAKDFEQLILSDWSKTNTIQREFGKAGIIARVNCLAERDLENSNINEIVEGHITLVVLPREPNTNTENLRQTIKRFLNQRRLISTRLHVIDPNYVKGKVSAILYLHDSADFQKVETEATRRIKAFFSPLDSQDYWQGKGYPFGADIYISELYQLFDDVPGVDYVEEVKLTDFEEHRELVNEQGKPIGISLQPHELVAMEIDRITIVTMQRQGDTWKSNN
ncbi:hypothetical protein [Microcoleus sp. D3_18a_C4]|uniref:hypothetical protein n=1 Tax=Microcoleus sp. D3_18a_C4 TaxID=3055332 RepID=UPI002FD76610